MLFLSFGAQATISPLIKEFMSINRSVVEKRLEVEISSLNLQAIEDKRPWSLVYSGSLTENKLDSSSAFSNQNSTMSVHSASLLKDTIWGGSFKLENVYYHEKRDPTNSAVVFGSTKNSYQFYQKVSYVQSLGANFFGRKEFKEREILRKTKELSEKTFDETLSSSLFGFYEAYLKTSLSKKLLGLQKEALLRAKKRTRLIKRMVKDGLRLNVDLMSAQMAEIAQAEAVNTAENDLLTNLDQLASLLHREVREIEVGVLDELDLGLPRVSMEELEKNKTLLKLEQAISQVQASIKNADYSVMPDIKLETSYKTNRIKAQNDGLFDEGKLGQSNHEVVFALNAVWPLGFGPQKAELQKQKVQHKILEHQKKSITSSLQQAEGFLRKRMFQLQQNIESAYKRVNLARLVLKQYNKLYDVGKKDLDQVIRSEEDLIRTETALYSYIAQRQIMVASLNQLYGTLVPKLKNI